jgi:hypothetical protein
MVWVSVAEGEGHRSALAVAAPHNPSVRCSLEPGKRPSVGIREAQHTTTNKKGDGGEPQFTYARCSVACHGHLGDFDAALGVQ